MDNLVKEEFLMKKGRMKKDPFKMAVQERKIWEKQMELNIRTHLFSIGQPLVYHTNGQTVAEFADGTIKEI